MTISQIIGYLTVIGISGTKYLTGVAIGAYFFDYTLKEFILCVFFGGILGTFVFVYLSEYIVSKWLGYKDYKAEKVANVTGKPKKESKKFTKKNRFLIKLSKNGGLYAVAFLTPIFLTYPIGAFLAVRFFGKGMKVISSFIIATLFWTFVVVLLLYVFGLKEDLQGVFK